MGQEPFTFDYFKKEVAFYGDIPPTKIENLAYDLTTLSGELMDYFNKNYYITDFQIPRLKIDGKVWMSITPMEVQSMYAAIQQAQYDVYTAGLGLGYFPLKAAAKEDVDRVIVYEQHPTIIKMFNKNFSDRPEWSKIEIRQADFLEALRNGDIDQDEFIFSDIYQTLNGDEALDHYEEFAPDYPGYCFWGQERLLLDAVFAYETRPPFLYPVYRRLFTAWLNTSVGEAVGDDSLNHVPLKDMYEPIWTENDCERFLEVFGAQ